MLVRFAAVTMFPAALVTGRAFAQPSDPKDPGGQIEIDPSKDSKDLKDPKDPKDPKIAKKWLATAQQLIQKGSAFAARNRLDDAKVQFENAVSAYRQAIEASDDVNIYADLASVEDRLGKVDEAVRHLRRVVNAKTGVRPDVAKKAAAKLEDLSAKVGLVTLTVTPAGSSITLGGVELGTSPLPESLVLMPGTYTLSFQAEGFQPMEAEIKIESGSEIERAIELEPVKVIVQPVKPAEPAGSDEAQHDKPRSRLPLYVGAGVTGAGVAGASIFGILAVKQHSKFTAASTSKLAREDARTAGQRYAFITDLSLGVTVVAAGFTAYWYFAKYKQRQKKPEDQRPSDSASGHASPPAGNDFASHPTKLDMIPWVQSQSGGIMIAGWF